MITKLGKPSNIEENEMEENKIEESEIEENDGFKFAVTLIIAFSTVLFKIHEYAVNNPLNNVLYIILFTYVPISFIVLGLILYLIIKGIAFETNDPIIRKKLKIISSRIYTLTFLYVFLGFLSFSLYVLGFTLIEYILDYIKDERWIYVEIFLLLLIWIYSALIILMGWKYIKRRSVLGIGWSPASFSSSLLIFIYSFGYVILMLFLGKEDTVGIKNIGEFVLILFAIKTVIPLGQFCRRFRPDLSLESSDSEIKDVEEYLTIPVLLIILTGIIIFPHLLSGDINVEMDTIYYTKE